MTEDKQVWINRNKELRGRFQALGGGVSVRCACVCVCVCVGGVVCFSKEKGLGLEETISTSHGHVQEVANQRASYFLFTPSITSSWVLRCAGPRGQHLGAVSTDQLTPPAPPPASSSSPTDPLLPAPPAPHTAPPLFSS